MRSRNVSPQPVAQQFLEMPRDALATSRLERAPARRDIRGALRAARPTPPRRAPSSAVVSSTGGVQLAEPVRSSSAELIANAARSAPSRSALLITNKSPISIRPAFIACTVSPDSGHQHDHRGVGGLRHFEFALPHTHGLDQNAREARGIEHVAHLRGVHREPAHAAARRHRADEHAGIARQLAHAHAIAEQRAAAERAGRDPPPRSPPSRRDGGSPERAAAPACSCRRPADR